RRCSSCLVAVPSCLACGDTKPMPECRCTPLYQSTKFLANSRASSRLSKGFLGNKGQYLAVRKSDSEYGLSSETLGLLYESFTPICSSLALKFAFFIGPPLS